MKKVDDLRDEITRYISLYELSKGHKPERVSVTRQQYDMLIAEQRDLPGGPIEGHTVSVNGVKVLPRGQ